MGILNGVIVLSGVRGIFKYRSGPIDHNDWLDNTYLATSYSACLAYMYPVFLRAPKIFAYILTELSGIVRQKTLCRSLRDTVELRSSLDKGSHVFYYSISADIPTSDVHPC
jgi:hypothetical protein